jgi:hypothetical protein
MLATLGCRVPAVPAGKLCVGCCVASCAEAFSRLLFWPLSWQALLAAFSTQHHVTCSCDSTRCLSFDMSLFGLVFLQVELLPVVGELNLEMLAAPRSTCSACNACRKVCLFAVAQLAALHNFQHASLASTIVCKLAIQMYMWSCCSLFSARAITPRSRAGCTAYIIESYDRACLCCWCCAMLITSCSSGLCIAGKLWLL